MSRTITVHGYRFNVETQGFVRARAEADAERAVEHVSAALQAMRPADVAALHAADRGWQLADYVGERPRALDLVESAAHAEATRGWHDPTAADISVSAAP